MPRQDLVSDRHGTALDLVSKPFGRFRASACCGFVGDIWVILLVGDSALHCSGNRPSVRLQSWKL